MDQVFEVVVGNGPGVMARDWEGAFHHAAALALGTDARTELARLGSGADNPSLAANGLGGSACHRIRHAICEARRGSEIPLEIRRHRLDAPPGHDSVVEVYDFLDGQDPAFLIQRALFRAEETDTPLELMAAELADDVAESLAPRSLFFQEAPDVMVQRLRRLEVELGTPESLRIVPAKGPARIILGRLPDLARERFLTLARTAFTETVSGAAPAV